MKTTSLIGLLLFSPLVMSQINVGETRSGQRFRHGIGH